MEKLKGIWTILTNKHSLVIVSKSEVELIWAVKILLDAAEKLNNPKKSTKKSTKKAK